MKNLMNKTTMRLLDRLLFEQSKEYQMMINLMNFKLTFAVFKVSSSWAISPLCLAIDSLVAFNLSSVLL